MEKVEFIEKKIQLYFRFLALLTLFQLSWLCFVNVFFSGKVSKCSNNKILAFILINAHMNALRYICIFEHLVEVGKMRSPFMKAKIARKKCDRFGVSKVKFNIKIPSGMKNFPYDSVSHLGSNYRFGVS